MAEFPLPVLQIFDDNENESVFKFSWCKYYRLHLVPKFGDVRDRQNLRLHPTEHCDKSDNLFPTWRDYPWYRSTEAMPFHLSRQPAAWAVQCLHGNRAATMIFAGLCGQVQAQLDSGPATEIGVSWNFRQHQCFKIVATELESLLIK